MLLVLVLNCRFIDLAKKDDCLGAVKDILHEYRGNVAHSHSDRGGILIKLLGSLEHAVPNDRH